MHIDPDYIIDQLMVEGYSEKDMRILIDWADNMYYGSLFRVLSRLKNQIETLKDENNEYLSRICELEEANDGLINIINDIKSYVAEA